MKFFVFWLVAAASIVPVCVHAQQQQPQPAKAAPYQATITTSSQEVLLDLVVRDKRGRPVKDLKKEEISVTDEGVAQTLRSFRLTSSADAEIAPNAAGEPKPANAVPAAPLNPMREIRLVTFVFEGLDRESATNAKRAALDFLKAESGANLYFAVFMTDQRLMVLQQYTADKALVEAAIMRATNGSAYSLYSDQSNRIAQELKTLATLDATQQSAAPSGGAPSASSTAGMANAAMAQMTLNMMQFAQTAERTQQSRASVFGLLGLVREQYRLPGRKTLIYFNTGLRVQPELEDVYRNIIATANRANVSFYAVDARGLNTTDQNAEAGSMLRQAIRSSANQQARGSAAVTPDQAKAMDMATDSIRGNVQNKLAELAENTGGFLISNTNEFKAQMKKVSEDLNSYYEVSYSPQIDNFDGSIRRISVKVSRPDVRVQSRTFYYALPFVEGGQQIFSYEVPMIRAISSNPIPRNISFRSSALQFRTPAGAPNTAFVLDVPLSGLTFSRIEESKSYKAHFSVLMLIRNPAGNIVQKLTRDVPTEGPLVNLDALRSGHFIYTQHLDLPPGRYTVESVVFDQENMKIGAKRQAMLVPETKPGDLGISSLAMVRSAGAAASPSDAEDPFQFEGGKVTPALDDTVKAEKGASVGVYFHVYRAKGEGADPALTMEVLQDGKAVAKGEPKLPAADANGRIAFIANLPVETLQPGQYEIRATVKQGPKAAQDRILVNVE